MPSAMANSAGGRYLAIDSLRGIAALSVALFHLHAQAFREVDSGILAFLSAIFQYGYLGVPIFFVISGFVIAATVKPPDVTFKYIGKFMVKRSTRLDPPYWLSIALEITLIYLTLHLFQIPQSLPTAGHVAAHAFYLQNLLGMGDIAANYWTLCLEVQFYIFLALVFALANKAGPAGVGKVKWVARTVFAVTGLLSLLIAADVMPNLWQGLFLSHWYLFLLGAVCYWSSIARTLGKPVFFGYCALALVVFVAQLRENHFVALNTLVAVLTTCFLYLAVARGRMSTWLNHRILLYLGAISYSLYLFHAIIGDRFISFVRKWLLPRLDLSLDAYSALALFLSALVITTFFAHLVYRFVERPSVKLSKRIKPASDSTMLQDIRTATVTSLPAAPAARHLPVQ